MIRLPFISTLEREHDFIGKASSLKKFAVSPEELGQFFDHENLSKHERFSNLRKMGGISGLQNILRMNIKDGIDNEDFQDILSRVIEFGENLKIERKTASFWQICSLQFQVKIYKFLLLNAITYFLVDYLFPDFDTGLEESLALLTIFLFLAIIIIITTYVKYKKYLQVLKLAEFKEVRVIRSGKVRTIPSTDIVVGDLLFVDNGDIVPVDGVLFKANDILCYECGAQIYKRVPVKYTEEEKCDPFLISGDKILEGHGVLIVCAVGVNSVLGKLKLAQAKNGSSSVYMERETKLMKKVGIIYSDISKIGFISAIVTFLAMMVHFFLGKLFSGESLLSIKNLRSVLNSVLIMFAIIVVILPEGLGIALSSALTYTIVKLREKNSIVRYFSACETLGYVNNIVSDQTGIFTKNRMTVSSLFIEENIYNSAKNIELVNKDSLQLLGECICINSSAAPKFWGNGEVERQGDEIECSLLELAYKLGYNYEDYRPSSKIKKIFPFSPDRRIFSTLYQNSDYDYRLLSYGSPAVLLEKCNYYINYRGARLQMNEDFRESLEGTVIIPFSNHALKSVVLAYRDVNTNIQVQDFTTWSEDLLETNLTFISLIGIKDPLRDDVPEAVSLCNSSGITVRMVTNDSVETAISIAKDCGILGKSYDINECNNFAVMEGKDFRQYVGVAHNPYKPKGEELNIKDFNAFEEIISDLRVLARSTPEDKYLLISGLKELGNVVALSGNGADDVNALRKADVGFAMGNTGSDIAKDVSDVILLDDNFGNIVNSIKWGRNIFDIVRKFLQLLLCINLIFIAITFLGSIVHMSTPLTAIHMIWIDLLLNILSSFALASENPAEDVLARGPFNWNEYIISPFMRITIIFQSIYGFSVLVFILLFSDGVSLFGEATVETKKTIIFNTLAFLIIFNQINSRKIKKKDYNVFKGIFENRLFVIITIIMVVIQVMAVEYGGKPLECVPLNQDEWLFCVGGGFGSLLIGFLARILPETWFTNIRFFKEEKRKDEFSDKLVEKLMGKRNRNVLM